jgi:hypothetical protein
LNFTNSAVANSNYLVALDFSMPQNYLGRCLSIVGSSNCKFALLILHASIKAYNASTVFACFFPNFRWAFRYVRLVVLHFALNHGAKCLSHLLGFANCRRVEEISTTPAKVASASRNSSTLIALASFVRAVSSMIA